MKESVQLNTCDDLQHSILTFQALFNVQHTRTYSAHTIYGIWRTRVRCTLHPRHAPSWPLMPHHLSTESAQPHQWAARFRQEVLQQPIHSSHSSIGCTHDIVQAYRERTGKRARIQPPHTSHRRRIHAWACSLARVLTAPPSHQSSNTTHLSRAPYCTNSNKSRPLQFQVYL